MAMVAPGRMFGIASSSTRSRMPPVETSSMVTGTVPPPTISSMPRRRIESRCARRRSGFSETTPSATPAMMMLSRFHTPTMSSRSLPTGSFR